MGGEAIAGGLGVYVCEDVGGDEIRSGQVPGNAHLLYKQRRAENDYLPQGDYKPDVKRKLLMCTRTPSVHVLVPCLGESEDSSPGTWVGHEVRACWQGPELSFEHALKVIVHCRARLKGVIRMRFCRKEHLYTHSTFYLADHWILLYGILAGHSRDNPIGS